MRRPLVREVISSLIFSLFLIGISEIVIRVTDLPRLSVLIVVFIVGYLVAALIQLLRSKRSAAVSDEDQRPVSWHP